MAKQVIFALALLGSSFRGAQSARAQQTGLLEATLNETALDSKCTEKAVNSVCECNYYDRALSVGAVSQERIPV